MSVRVAVRFGSLSTPTSRTLIRSPSPGTGRRRHARVVGEPGALEDRRERVAEDRAVSVHDEVGDARPAARSPRSRRHPIGPSARPGSCRGRPGPPRSAARRARPRSAPARCPAPAARRSRPGAGPATAAGRAPAPRAAADSDGTTNSTASARRRLNAWPSPGTTADSPAAARRRRSMGPVSGRIRRACTIGSGPQRSGVRARVYATGAIRAPGGRALLGQPDRSGRGRCHGARTRRRRRATHKGKRGRKRLPSPLRAATPAAERPAQAMIRTRESRTTCRRGS